MGRLKRIIYICLAMVLCFVTAAPSVHAAGNIDPGKMSSLTIKYANSGKACEGVQIRTYRVASVDAAGNYTLCDAFKGYNVHLNGITSQEEWKAIATTLDSYAAADKIVPYCSGITDSTGIVRFKNIKTGMYLTTAVNAVAGNEVIHFEAFLTAVPNYDDGGNYNYNVIAYPKSHAYVPGDGIVEYTVVKQWKDSGDKENRPDNIRIEIIKNGEHHSYHTLSAENNWSYSWTTSDPGSRWQVVERDVFDKYKVSIEHKGQTIIITNTFDNTLNTGDGDIPQTGDTTSLWPYVGVMCFAGAVMLLFAIWSKREEEHE